MKHKFQKHLHILSDLMAYFHSFGAADYEMGLTEEAHGTSFRIRAAVTRFTAEDLDELREVLAIPRQPEVEHDYWELSGESDDCELTLTSMMLDSAEVTYEDGILTITAMRLE